MEFVDCRKCGFKNPLPIYEMICGNCGYRLYLGRNAQYVERELTQGTPTWHDWRREGIGASEAPTAMGVSKFMSIEKLVKIKTGKTPEPPSNKYMSRGKELEKPARELYIKKTGITVHPSCLESLDRGWMRASLDGWSKENHLVVEIKCPQGEKDHSQALRGKVPEHYYPQLQHILAVTGFSEIDYWSFRKGKGVLLKVKRDENYIQKLISTEVKIWHRITSDKNFNSGSKVVLTCPNPSCSKGLKVSTGGDLPRRVFVCMHCGIEFELYESPWGIKPRIKSN